MKLSRTILALHLRLSFASPAIDLETHRETRMFVCIITLVTYIYLYIDEYEAMRLMTARRCS